VRHLASRSFWKLYDGLPEEARRLADEKYQLLKSDPHHASLHLKRIGKVWSVRAGLRYRALGHDIPDGIQWFWIGTHADHDKLIG
jgi:hypothetical protein